MRKRKPDPEYFGTFEDVVSAWLERGQGRHIYCVDQIRGPYLLAATQLQAVKCLMKARGSPVKKVSSKDMLKIMAEKTKARRQDDQAKSNSGDVSEVRRHTRPGPAG